MNESSGVTVRWSVGFAAAVALLAAGAGAMYFALQGARSDTGGASGPVSDTPVVVAPSTLGDSSAPPAASASQPALPDVIVAFGRDAVERARLVTAPVAVGTASQEVRLPGVVEANAYRTVAVTPLVAGRITQVFAELGQTVKEGQALAQIFSPELADAETRYLSMRAELDAHERELQRTEKLIEIGAASRQELERIHAEHTARTADVQSARSRLELLGRSPAAIANLVAGKAVSAATAVPAPIAGIVTERLANVGLNVDASSKLFTVVDLSSVWVVGNLYELDFSRVRIGSPATITTTAYPNLVLRGKVSYIDPQLSPETRTAKVRVEVPNRRGELRLGMYAEAAVGGEGGVSVMRVPRSAVQTVGDRQVVYVVDSVDRGTFVERAVVLGAAAGDRVDVLSGVEAGDVVVAQGSFFVRAERERLGLRPSPSPPPTPAAAPVLSGTNTPPPSTPPGIQTAKVVVGEQGFDPDRLRLRANVPARITFVRTTDNTCGTEVEFPALKIERALPLNEPVVIEFTPAKDKEIAFACGMNMLRGVVVVE